MRGEGVSAEGICMMDQRDQDRIKGREWAEEVMADVRSHVSDDYQEGFWRRIEKELPRRKEDDSSKAMTDEQSKAFGRSMVEFGKYIFQRYDDVPLDYLEWLADQNTTLARYLESRRIREERKEAE